MSKYLRDFIHLVNTSGSLNIGDSSNVQVSWWWFGNSVESHPFQFLANTLHFEGSESIMSTHWCLNYHERSDVLEHFVYPKKLLSSLQLVKTNKYFCIVSGARNSKIMGRLSWCMVRACWIVNKICCIHTWYATYFCLVFPKCSNFYYFTLKSWSWRAGHMKWGHKPLDQITLFVQLCYTSIRCAYINIFLNFPSQVPSTIFLHLNYLTLKSFDYKRL